MTIHAILLVPAEGDPLGLLAEGVCGAKPPLLFWYECAEHGGSWGGFGRFYCGQCSTRTEKDRNQEALVLAWDGKPVPEGCFYARALTPARWRSLEAVVSLALRYGTASPEAHILHRSATDAGCRLVLLDADGREVTA